MDDKTHLHCAIKVAFDDTPPLLGDGVSAIISILIHCLYLYKNHPDIARSIGESANAFSSLLAC